MNQQEIVYLG